MGQANCSNCNCTNREGEQRIELDCKDSASAENQLSTSVQALDLISADSFSQLQLAKHHLSDIIKIQAVWRGYQVRKQSVHLQKQQTSPSSRYFQRADRQGTVRKVGMDSETRPAVTLLNGATYSGQWKGAARHGSGVQSWPDGAKYEGNWKDNKAQGHGKFLHVDGDVFEGNWQEDKANGKGTYEHSSGASYQGDW